jgi:hypothetical protein
MGSNQSNLVNDQVNQILENKSNVSSDAPAPIVNNTTNVNQTNTTSPKRNEKENDRPAILEKSRG